MEDFMDKHRRAILVVIIVAIIILLSLGIIKYFSGKKQEPVEPDNGIIVEDDNKEEDNKINPEGGIDLQEEIKALNLKYKDATSWIRIPGTSIDIPVFQAINNERYLRHDRDNKRTSWGETFLDYRSNINNMDDRSHFIIYGHNTSRDTHFTPIIKYKDKKFYEEHKIIEYSTINGNYKWEIFSMYRTTPDFFYIDTVFKDKAEFKSFLDICKSKSMHETNVNLTEDDTILTLSTCDYTLKDGRFVVQARLIRE